MSKITIQSSTLKRAEQGDKEAVKSMFESFISENETIIDSQYFGKYGLIFPERSFVCVTDKRLAVLSYKSNGQIIYQDGFIEEINSGVVYQPSIIPLYVIGVLLCLTIISILLLNAWINLYYKIKKSGMVWSVREGVNIYAFANRSNINKVAEFWRQTSYMRTKRIEVTRK